ncbi:MAG: hypothetical protein R6X25_04680 [Candidatus Krumholzibacteriia bacterium]
MVSILSLWLPILVSAVLVFVASSIIHMVLSYHRNDFEPFPEEDRALAAFRGLAVPPGDYVAPYAGSAQAMKQPEYRERRRLGPVVIATVASGGSESLGKGLAQWFLYSVVVSVFAAYVAGRALGPGADYLDVFRFAGTTAVAGYSLALAQNSIWYRRKWGATLRSMFDGLIYGLLTAGAFGAFWPH